jgi:hypothetical protein
MSISALRLTWTGAETMQISAPAVLSFRCESLRLTPNTLKILGED